MHSGVWLCMTIYICTNKKDIIVLRKELVKVISCIQKPFFRSSDF